MILERCEGVRCVDLDESFQTHIFLQNLASTQPRTIPVKFARSGNAADVKSREGPAAGPSARRSGKPVISRSSRPRKKGPDWLHLYCNICGMRRYLTDHLGGLVLGCFEAVFSGKRGHFTASLEIYKICTSICTCAALHTQYFRK